jgi:hypothetical protein
VLIGNADAPGKNIALLHPTAEHVELALLYDTVPTALWPKLRRKAAMSIGGRYELDPSPSPTLSTRPDRGGMTRNGPDGSSPKQRR